MNRDFYLKLADKDLVQPIGTDLVLHEKNDPEAVRLDGRQLGEVIIESARRYRTPLAFPLMDLRIEKEDLLTILGVPAEDILEFHFPPGEPGEDQLAQVKAQVAEAPPTPVMASSAEAISVVAREEDLVPMGMCIGPFSLLTKLIDDPITTIYMAAMDEEEDEFEVVRRTMDMTTAIVLRWLDFQVKAGMKAVCLCEPACNTVYLSPNQLEQDPDILEKFVMQYLRRIKEYLDANDVDLVFHDCGELLPAMIRAFGTLDPAILSFGSPVNLWEAAPLVPKTTVLFGNLPSKKFYSDKEFPEDKVREESRVIREKMEDTGHPYILASECDVLCVKGHEETIRRKVGILLDC